MMIKLNLKYTIIFICIVIFTLQDCIKLVIPQIAYFDEMIALLLFVYWLLKTIKSGIINRSSSTLLLLIIIFVALGLIGNYFGGAGQPISAIFQDVLSNIKMFLVFLPLMQIKVNKHKLEKLKDYISVFIRILFIVLFITAVISLFANIGMSAKQRYGINSYKFILGPALLNSNYYLYMMLFSLTIYKGGKLRKNSTLFMIIGCIPWILTLRTRAIAFALIYIFLYFNLLNKQQRKFNLKKYIVPISGISFLIGYDAIDRYFISGTNQARYILLHGAINLAKKYFPLGAGFGTYGTQASKSNYSKIYYDLNIASHWAMNEESASYLLDQYWFAILGQFGVVGFIIIAYMIYRFFKYIWTKTMQNKQYLLAVITMMYTTIFGSLTAASFIQSTFIGMIFTLMIFLGDSDMREVR